MAQRLRRPVMLVAALVVAFVGLGVAPASAATQPYTITIRDEDGQLLPAGIATAVVCAAGPDCADRQDFSVPADGQIVAMLDPTKSYGLNVNAYTQFHRSVGLPTGTAFAWSVPGIGQPRQLTGTVAIDGVRVGQGGGGGTACPIDESGGPCVAPGQGPGMQVLLGQTNVDGEFSMTLNSAARYNLRGYANGGVLLSQITEAPPGSTAPVTRDYDFITEGTTFAGTLTRTGFTTFPAQVAGVGACPVGTVYPDTCTNPRVAYTDSTGQYSLRLPEGDWNISGFVFIDGAPVIGPAVQRSVPAESAPPTSPVALDINGDVNTIAASSTEVQAPDGSGAITVSTNGDSLANVAAVPSSAVLTDIPDDVDLSYGVLSFTSPVAPRGTAIFDVTFPEPLPLDVEWYKVRDGVWTAHPDVVRVDDFTLRISIVDGSTADDDRTVNGYVTDPGYLGTSASPEVLEAFAAPISTTGMNVTKAKSSTPVKWRLLREGVAVTDPAHFVGLSSAPGGPGCSPSLGDAVFVDPGGLAYVKGFWKLTWKAPATKGCYTLTLHVAGQQPVSATFTVR